MYRINCETLQTEDHMNQGETVGQKDENKEGGGVGLGERHQGNYWKKQASKCKRLVTGDSGKRGLEGKPKRGQQT